jgi:hypothetical protein
MLRLRLIVSILAGAGLLVAFLPESANAQLSAKKHDPAKATMKETGGVETITPQEAPSKETSTGNGWSGAYVGVNAGRSFGATAGTNVVVPFGTSGKSEK